MLGTVANRVNVDRAAEAALALARVASPTGDTVEVSRIFRDMLGAAGAVTRQVDAFPRTPVVIGEWRGSGDAPTLVLNGHLDTVPVAHPPAERRNGRVSGRGTADMKGALAAALEALCAIRDAGLRPRGGVILCAHGLHEAPGGCAEDLAHALTTGAIRGDAALVLEVAHDTLPVAGMGSAVYRARFHAPREVSHELRTPPATPHPAAALADAIHELRALDERLREVTIPPIGPESVFIGQAHCGDFYNRFPNEAWLEGTRRYDPEADPAAVEDDLHRRLQSIASAHGLELEFSFFRVRDGFRIDGSHPLVAAVEDAYRDEMGRDLPRCGIRVVADAPVFQRYGGIPCVYHGPAGHGAHADEEWIEEAELGRVARTYVRIIERYVGLETDRARD